jgi:hypothetical protein
LQSGLREHALTQVLIPRSLLGLFYELRSACGAFIKVVEDAEGK